MQDIMFLLLALISGIAIALIIYKVFDTGYKIENGIKKDDDNFKIK